MHLSLNAFEVGYTRYYFEFFQELLDAGSLIDFLAHVHFPGVSQPLHPGSNVDGLTKIIQTVVQRNGNTGASMDTYLENNILGAAHSIKP